MGNSIWARAGPAVRAASNNKPTILARTLMRLLLAFHRRATLPGVPVLLDRPALPGAAIASQIPQTRGTAIPRRATVPPVVPVGQGGKTRPPLPTSPPRLGRPTRRQRRAWT